MPEENARITRAVLAGEKSAMRNAVALNAGAALYMAGKTESMEQGVRMAEALIDSGKAMAKPEEFVRCSNQ